MFSVVILTDAFQEGANTVVRDYNTNPGSHYVSANTEYSALIDPDSELAYIGERSEIAQRSDHFLILRYTLKISTPVRKMVRSFRQLSEKPVRFRQISIIVGSVAVGRILCFPATEKNCTASKINILRLFK